MRPFRSRRRILGLAGLLLGLACTTCGGDGGGGGTGEGPDAAATTGEPVPAAVRNPLATTADAVATPIWELARLPPEFLDRIQEEIGRRAGVRVVRVVPGGVAQRTGVHDGDVVLALGDRPVDAPQALEAALAARAGAIRITLLRVAEDGAWSLSQLSLPAASTPAPAAPEPPEAASPEPVPPSPAAAGPPDRSPRGSVAAYFDMLDFCRTEAWGRPSVTSDATRKRAETLLRANLPELDAPMREAIRKIPDAWAALRARWAAAGAADRAQQRVAWARRLLLPDVFLPVDGPLRKFVSEAGHHAFEHPADWVIARTREDDVGMLYLGPPGTETTWRQVVDPATSPPGVLFAIAPTDEGLRAVNTPVEGARYVARRYVTARAPAMREVAAFPLGTGALVSFVGRWPGATEESFCWVGSMPFGNDRFLAGRFSGLVSQAETLLPAFSVILATTEVTPPDDLANLQVNLAASIIGNAVINTGWSH